MTEQADYKATFSKAFLTMFIELLNSNRIEDVQGNIVKFTVEYYNNNEIAFSSSVYTKEYYEANSDKIYRELKKDKVFPKYIHQWAPTNNDKFEIRYTQEEPLLTVTCDRVHLDSADGPHTVGNT